MSETLTITVGKIVEKHGEKNGRAWTRHSLYDGNDELIGSTFDKSALGPAEAGAKVDVEREKNGQYWNIVAVTSHVSAPSSSVNGEADWDLIGLRKTRCALWAAFLAQAVPVCMAEYTKSHPNRKPGELKHYLQTLGRDLVTAAEVDIFHRGPAGLEEDIPF